jgi:hypothetical protein
MQPANSMHGDGRNTQPTLPKGLIKLSTEPLWVAGIFIVLLTLSVIAGLLISGFFGLLIATFPLTILLLILALINPYPFWLMYLALVPLMLIFKDYFPTGSFTRFIGLFMVALSIPYLLCTKKTFKFRITSLGASLLLFFTGCVLSLLSFFNLSGSLVGVGLFLGNVLAYWVFINLFSSRKRLLAVINTLIVVLTAEAIIGIVQKFTGPALIRSQGTITDPNYFGHWLLPFVCISFYLGVGEKKWWSKLLYFSAYALMTIAIPLTYSRSMILVLIPIQFILYWRQKKLLLFILLAAVMAGILYLGFIQLFEGNFSISSFFTAARVGSIEWRYYFATTSLRIFFDHPLAGVGADNFAKIFRFYSEITPRIAYAVIHNSYLEILSGTGLVGFVPFMAVIFFSLRNFWKTRNDYKRKGDRSNALFTEGLLIGFIAFLLGHLFLSAQHHIILWFLIAASTIVVNISHNQNQEISNSTSVRNQGSTG